MSLLFDVQDGIAVITLNRPEAMNSIDPETREELGHAWQRIADDEEIRCVVFTGSGEKAFCTGSDLKKTPPPKETFAQLTFGGKEPENLLDGLKTNKPTICAINGYAIGGGLELALACDIRIASRNAQFGLSEARVGSIPGFGGTQRLPRLIGESNALYLMLTGTRIDADEAFRLGLVSKVVDDKELLPHALEIASQIAKNAPLSVRAIKRLVKDGLNLPLDDALRLERYVFGLLRDSEDRLEGRRAFAEKRPPVFKGR